MPSMIVDSKIALINLRRKAVKESVPFRCVLECLNVFLFRNKVN